MGCRRQRLRALLAALGLSAGAGCQELSPEAVARLLDRPAGEPTKILLPEVAEPFGIRRADGAAGAGAEASADASAGSAAKPDKSRYFLLNPTPSELQRKLADTSDRPSRAFGPYTVDAGHLQFETGLLDFLYDRRLSHDQDPRRRFDLLAGTAKVGLTNRIDLELGFAPLNFERTQDRDTGEVTREFGFGDLVPAAKINLWGDDGGSTAFALLPFLQLPTGTGGMGNRAIEGGLVLPLTVKLPAGFALTYSPEFDIRRNCSGRGRHAEFINTILLSHDLVPERLAGFVEFYPAVSTERGANWVGTADAGLELAVNRNLALDVAVYLGANRSAPDVTVTTGFVMRF